MLCSICLEPLHVIEARCVKTTCGHFFHLECMKRWFQVRHECAMCRSHLTIYDCTSMEVSCITSPTGIIVNGIRFYAQTIHEFSLVLLYVFFLQHAIIPPSTSPTLDNKLSTIIHQIVQTACYDKETNWTSTYPLFYKKLDFCIHVLVPRHSYIKSIAEGMTVAIDDIRFLLRPQTISSSNRLRLLS